MSTSRRTRASARRFILAFAAALLLLATGAAAANAAQTVTPNGYLQVWNFNTHRMDRTDIPDPDPTDPIRSDYRGFLTYITDPARTYLPDVITLQESGTASLGVASCQQLVTELENRTSPRVDYDCKQTTEQGGAAVVFRTGRLTYQTGSGTKLPIYVRDGAGCTTPSTSWYAQPARFLDSYGRYVNVAAVHFHPNGLSCGLENANLVNNKLVSGLGSSSLQIMGGDWNEKDAQATNNNNTFTSWNCGYAATNWALGCYAQFGYKDPMYQQCKLQVTTEADRYSCLHIYHWSFTPDPINAPSVHDRRDFLFAKPSSITISNQVTVDSYPNPMPWSDHRAQGALLQF
jgi:hypothetical protein